MFLIILYTLCCKLPVSYCALIGSTRALFCLKLDNSCCYARYSYGNKQHCRQTRARTAKIVPSTSNTSRAPSASAAGPSVHTAAVISDLHTYLRHPNPCFALGSRIDRQWFPWLTNHHIGDDLLCGIGLFYTHPLPNENNFYI